MDIDTIKYLRDLLLKGESTTAIRILDAEIDGEAEDAQEEEDEGWENEALIDKHTESLRGD